MAELTARFLSSINEVDATLWHQLFDTRYPFTRHEFLAALEQSGSTTANTGWKVSHLALFAEQQLVAVLPLYIKSHSYGEYIFDWSWAEAYERNGIEYYPKLVSAIPYTPATGPRLGILPEYRTQTDNIVKTIAQHIESFGRHIEASNWQCLFPTEQFSKQLAQQGWQQRQDTQFHWFNRGYQSFDEFVATFASRKRKNVLKERHKVLDSDIQIRVFEGDEIDDSHWQQFFVFYQMTYLKRSRHGGYLNQDFFNRLGRTMASHLMMICAEHQGQIVAAALFFKSNDTLYGRYWGCIESHQFLHFECCYYQGIDYCIKHQLTRFDAGAQGEHKLQRGFEPVITYANYHIEHPQFSQAIGDYLKQEKAHIHRYIDAARSQLPYKAQ